MLFDDPSFAFVAYNPFLGYGQSRPRMHWSPSRRPGGIATNLQRHFDPEVLAQARRAAGAGTVMKSVQHCAATSMFVATSALLDGIGGRYFEDCNQARMVTSRADSDGRSVSSHSHPTRRMPNASGWTPWR